ncbi:MAG: branched-chain amino acid ABC transporter permease [Nocardioides sp.]|uniref:branched-chain amino acid ABC transporter permease n=1 Tax=Nocardioides sp. TaxID=35761 RepID=UPI003F0192EF
MIPASKTRTRPGQGHRSRAVGLLASALLVLAALLLPGLALSPAHAEDGSGIVRGTLKDAENNDAPVEGVSIVVTGPDGTETTGESDADGRFEIEVPVPEGGGTFEVAVTEDTFPEGVKLREGEPNPRTVKLQPGGSASAIFPFGADNRQVEGSLDRIPQLVYNGLLFGIVIALGSLGLSMVFGTTGLTNFSHGELVTFGALVAFLFNSTFELPFALAAVLAVIGGALLGFIQDKGLWGPLRKRGTGLIAMMIVSIGLMFFLRNVFQYVTRGRANNYREYVTVESREALGVTYATRDLMIAAISILVLVVVILALSKTRLGRATRAVSDNPALASSTGINVSQVITLVWVVGGALAALCGVFLGFTMGVTFTIGQLVLLLLFAAVTVGGLGSIWGAVIGSLIIGLLIELSTLVIPSDLKNAGALVLLALILLFRPQGLLGRKERIG